MNRHFQAKRAKYSKVHIMDSKQILHTSKNQQICFVGGPETWNTNPRWRTAEYLASGSLPVPARPFKLVKSEEQNSKFN